MTSNASSLIRTVDEMLLDADGADAIGLRETLLSLGALGSLPVPEPGPELAAFLSGQTHELARHRLFRQHRTTVVGLAVIAGMGLGVTGVAATGTVPNAQASGSIQQLLQDWAPGWSVAGTPAFGGSAANPAEVPLEPASPADAAPAQPADVEPDTAAPGPDIAGGNAGTDPPGRGTGGWPDTQPGRAKTDDGGAPGNAPDGTPGGAGSRDTANRDAANRDAASKDRNGPAKGATDAAVELDKAGKLVAGTLADAAAAGEPLTSAVVPPALSGKTGASGASPGSNWLRKFNR